MHQVPNPNTDLLRYGEDEVGNVVAADDHRLPPFKYTLPQNATHDLGEHQVMKLLERGGCSRGGPGRHPIFS